MKTIRTKLRIRPIHLVGLLIIAALLATVALVGLTPRSTVTADTAEIFVRQELDIVNPNFGEASGGVPMTPVGWTGAALGNFSAPNIISGVVELTIDGFDPYR